jgi:hypothetical protein
MTGYQRQLRLRQIPVDDVEIGAANATGMNSEENLPGPSLGLGNLLERERLPLRMKHHRPHGTRIIPHDLPPRSRHRQSTERLGTHTVPNPTFDGSLGR